jgi:hypothetical protein
VEFDGWKERHWTLPFKGERFSLVFFTPLGCDAKDFFWLPRIENENNAEADNIPIGDDGTWHNRMYVCAVSLVFLGNMVLSRSRHA